MPTTSVLRSISLFSRSSGLVDPHLPPVRFGEVGGRGDVGPGGGDHGGDGRELGFEHAGDLLDPHGRGGGLGEDGRDCGGDHAGVALANFGEHVAQEMHPAASPGGPMQHRAAGGDQTAVGVADDQLHSKSEKSPVAQAAQELSPERLAFAVADAGDADLAVGGVKGQAGELCVQGAAGEGIHLLITGGADPAHLASGHSGQPAHRGDRSSTCGSTRRGPRPRRSPHAAPGRSAAGTRAGPRKSYRSGSGLAGSPPSHPRRPP